MKIELVEEKVMREKAQCENETLAHAVDDLKKSADGFVAQIPDLEEKIKLTELRAQELNLEWTTKAKEDYKN
jgi:t-SNARE complex subunit (syntaxin)